MFTSTPWIRAQKFFRGTRSGKMRTSPGPERRIFLQSGDLSLTAAVGVAKTFQSPSLTMKQRFFETTKTNLRLGEEKETLTSQKTREAALSAPEEPARWDGYGHNSTRASKGRFARSWLTRLWPDHKKL
jgi:hypothetical protein